VWELALAQNGMLLMYIIPRSLVFSAGAISVSGLKTITIRNMALAKRSLEVIVKVVPDVKEHFESVHRNKIKAKSTISELRNASSTQSMDACFRQLDLAVKHLSNHADELQEKMLTVAWLR
jgi:vacuolar protein sorting-associated protein 54